MLSHVDTPLKQTPLYSAHIDLGAKVVPFAGWQMPVSYPSGILSECQQTRTLASLFDTCHMGEFLVEGDCFQSGLDALVTASINDMPVKTCRYAVTLNDNGGIIDDLIVYRLAPDQWMIVVNAGNIDKDEKHFLSHLKSEKSFKNISPETGKLDIQGPLAREILKDMVKGIEKLNYYSFDHFDVLGERCIVSRTGYTGELGFEIYFPRHKINILWERLLENKNIKPAGLGARDILRVEMGYSLYGQDLDDAILPLEAGLDKFVDLSKDFCGKDGLLKEKQSGIRRKMIYFCSESRRAPRHHHKIFQEDGREIGFVTSGTFSPFLQKGIGFALIDRAIDLKGQPIFFGDEKNKIAAQLAGRPFYKKGTLKI
ncbi:MAG: glycine cleavage system aminomethyltransferase GcvT [Candidatus Omnitrophota bacterium]